MANTIVEIKTSYKCNHNCVFCLWGGRKKLPRMTLEEVRVATEYSTKHLNPACVILSGGEPTAWKHFPEVLTLIRAMPGLLAFHLHTNATLVADNREALASPVAQTNSATVGLHGHRASIHDEITGKPGSFHAAVSGIVQLIGMGYSVRVDSVVCRQNVMFLREITEFVLGLRVIAAEIRIPVVGPGVCLNEITPDANQLLAQLDSWMKRFAGEPKARLLATDARCFGSVRGSLPEAPYRFHFFDGRFPPGMESHGTDQLAAIWPEAYNGYRKGKACGSCVYDEMCRGFSDYEANLGLACYKPVDLDGLLDAATRMGSYAGGEPVGRS